MVVRIRHRDNGRASCTVVDCLWCGASKGTVCARRVIQSVGVEREVRRHVQILRRVGIRARVVC